MKVGRQIAKLQNDSGARDAFRHRLALRKEAELPVFTSPHRGMQHNRLVETLNLYTPRLALAALEKRKNERKDHAAQV